MIFGNIYKKKKIGNYTILLDLKNPHELDYFNDKEIIDDYIISNLIEKDYNIVDLGANVGYETVLYLNKTEGKVYSFEPFKIVYKQLKYIKKQAKNLFIYNIAIADENKKGILVLSDTHNQGNTTNDDYLKHFDFIFIKNRKQKIIMRTLDYFNLKEISFLKIDVEGAEHLVFKGAEEFFRNNNPIVQIEIYPFMEENIFDASKSMLKNIKRVAIDNKGNLRLLDKDQPIDNSKYKLSSPPTYLLFNDDHLKKLSLYFG